MQDDMIKVAANSVAGIADAADMCLDEVLEALVDGGVFSISESGAILEYIASI